MRIADRGLVDDGPNGILFVCPDSATWVVYGHPHGVAIFGPRPVILLRIVAQKFAENEPTVRGALANAAIDDGLLIRADAALLKIDLRQFRGRFECGIIVGCSFPRHTLCPGNMAAAQHALLRILGHVRNLTAIFAG